jgi:hypothetical protein
MLGADAAPPRDWLQPGAQNAKPHSNHMHRRSLMTLASPCCTNNARTRHDRQPQSQRMKAGRLEVCVASSLSLCGKARATAPSDYALVREFSGRCEADSRDQCQDPQATDSTPENP